MKAVFVELPPFERLRADYMDDESYRGLQMALMRNPLAGDVIEGTGGLRKLRHADPRRGKGKRGGGCASFTTGGSAAVSSGCSLCTTRMRLTI